MYREIFHNVTKLERENTEDEFRHLQVRCCDRQNDRDIVVNILTSNLLNY